MIKFLRTYLPHRSSEQWVGVIPQNRKHGIRFGKPIQIIGGRTWSISFMRHGQMVNLDEFWKNSVN